MKKLTDEQLEELAREKQREYLREWRKKNPDKVREYNKRYWKKKALEMLKEQQEAQEDYPLKQEQEQLWRYRWPITT